MACQSRPLLKLRCGVDLRGDEAMARPPGPGTCVHCLMEVPARNWDHVIPRSWYPDATPEDLEKWKVPSCVECNANLAALENVQWMGYVEHASRLSSGGEGEGCNYKICQVGLHVVAPLVASAWS